MPKDAAKPPEGLAFLALVGKMEDSCEATSKKALRKLGKQAPECQAALGTVLSLLDRVGSCWWSCPGGEYEGHLLQYMAARGSSYGRAALRLAMLGFYDEALAIVRSMGELANLLTLFQTDPPTLIEWRSSDHKKRRSAYQPGHIRRRLSELGTAPPMNDTSYSLLCELSTHPVPELRPQAFNQHGITTVGGRYQPVGLLLVLNETAVLASVILLFSALLCNVPKEHLKSIHQASVDCVNAAGGVSLSSLPDLFDKLRSDPNDAHTLS